MRSMGLLALGFAMLVLPGIASAAPGDLDPTFGGAGTVTTALTAGADAAWGVVVQPDGKIVAAGVMANANQDFAVVRYDATGALDAGFGTGGVVSTNFGFGNDVGRAVLRQPDGKIVVTGNARGAGANNDFGVARYNADGTLDAGFGTGGTVLTPIGTGNETPNAVARQTDGKLVAAGFATIAGNIDMALVRYNADGSLDATFGTGGIVTTAIGTGTDSANSVAVQLDGKIVVAGYASSGAVYEIAVVRYDAGGSLDATFGTGGIATTPVSGTYAIGTALQIQPDGKLVVGGYTGSPIDFALVRFNADGTLDATFGTGGKVATSIGAGTDQARGLLLQADGKLVLGGLTNISSGNDDVALAKYDADGNLDTGFGTGGIVVTPVGAGSDGLNGLALQADGKIVGAGFTGPVSSPDVLVVRYLNDVCGNGIVDGPEACDAGGANGMPGSCCSATCTIVTAGTECRAAAGPCDVAETCDGVTDTCPADSGLPDTDGDTVCDAIDNCVLAPNPGQENGDSDPLGDVCDPCTNVVPTAPLKQKLTLTKLLPPAGDDKLTLKGFFTDVPASPTIDPLANGLRVLITDSLGVTSVDVTIPGGAFDPGTKTGWKVNGAGTAWTYKGPGTGTNGIQKAQLKAIASTPGKYKFSVKGKNGTYPVNGAALPVTGTIVIDTPIASTGQCGEATFPATPPAKPSCAEVSGGKTIKCK